MEIGIIGFGRLGEFISRKLAQDFDLTIYEIKNKKSEIEAIGAKIGTLEEVCSKPIIIPFIPISEFNQMILSIKTIISPGSTVIDVCSVKEYPIEIMKKHLPENCHIIGSHPMFGPDSAKDTFVGSKIVLNKVRVPEKIYNDVYSYLNSHGLRVIETSPQEHDESISHSLLLTHFIGRGLLKIKAKNLLIDTKGYRRLMKILETVENDSTQLFQDMNKHNKYAKEVREEFLSAMNQISSELLK